MRLRITDTVLLASAVIFSHAVWTGARLVPIVYHALFHKETDASIRLIMPAVTRFASDFPLVFVVLICIVGFLAAMLSRNRPELGRAYLVAGVSAQGLISWVAAFCFCFLSFTGPICLHHDSSFDLPQFLTTAWGSSPLHLWHFFSRLVLHVGN